MKLDAYHKGIMEVYNNDRKVICRSAPSIFKIAKTNFFIFPKTVF
jgi:hypothetical protein